MCVVTYLAAVPDVVWSGLLAALITLAGVMVSNASNTRRLMRQLSHDSDEKARDRLAALRKDVYLKAAEEVAKVGGYLARIPQIDPVTENISDGLADFLAISARLQLVAQPATAGLASELTTRYGEIFLKLLIKASPIHDCNRDIKISGSYCALNQAECERILAEMKQMNETGRPDDQRFDALKRSFDIAQAAATRFADERSRSYEVHAEAMRAYSVELLDQMASINMLQIKLTASIRTELSLDTDVQDYEGRMEESRERMEEAMRDLSSHLSEGRDPSSP